MTNVGLSEHFTYRKLIRFVLPCVTMMIVTSVYCIVDGFFVSNCAGKNAFTALNLIYPVLMAVLGAIILVLSLMLDRYMVSSVTRNGESEFIDVTNHFFFTDKELTIQNDRAVRTHTYAKLYRVYETNEYIFFFTGKRSFLMLRKSQITKGTPMALRNLVSAHAPRYILCQGL